MNPRVEAAVLETARGGILRAGLAFDQCDVAVVTNIGEGDHLGLNDIDTVERLAAVKRTIVETVAKRGTAVLKADDPLVAAMAEHCPGSVLFFGRDGDCSEIVVHRAAGGKAVFVRDETLILADGPRETALIRLADIPLTHGGRVGFQVENVLSATAAAWSLGVSLDAIVSGLESFKGEMNLVPGRFNLLEIGGTTVIVDYGHNVSALASLLEAIETFPHERRTAIYSAAGDRRDEDLIRQGEMLGETFDHVMIYEDKYTRGRKPGEIIALFRKGLDAGRRVARVSDFQGALKAIEVAINDASPGDLVLIQADEIDTTLELIRRLIHGKAGGREVDFNEALEASEAMFAHGMD